jgi:hypothetical protein
MEANPEFFLRLLAVNWFAQCGVESPDDFPFGVQRLKSVVDAIASAESNLWADVKTEAQGDLTEYLAKNHYDAYGDWNRLGDAIEERIQSEVMPTVNEALEKMGAQVLSEAVLLDLTRIALWSAYNKRFRRVPDFFQRLLMVYERGHLPCGWSGNLDSWPAGQVVIY